MNKTLNLSSASGFDETFNNHSRIKDKLKNKFREFVKWKMKYPSNGTGGGMPGFGSSDYKFSPQGPFGKSVKNIAHAHLDSDVSILYRIVDNTLYVYGVFAHKELGTTDSPNIRLQQRMATRFDNSNFEPLNIAALDDTPATPSTVSSPAQQKNYKPTVDPRYAPRVKQAPQQSNRSKMLSAVKTADSIFPQRQLFQKISNAQDIDSIKRIIQIEGNMIMSMIQSRTANSLHRSYFDALKEVVKFLE